MHLRVFGTLTILTLAGAMAAFADTEVSGELAESTTWAKENSPYVLVGDFTVPEGITLTIEPGVTAILKKDSGLYDLDVYGSIIAEGTSMAQRDIRITDGGKFTIYGEARLKYCILENRDRGVALRGGTYAKIRGCLIKDNTWGIYCENVRADILENLIVNNELGIWIVDAVECNISSNTIAHNNAMKKSIGLQIYGDGIIGLYHNNIYDNGGAINWFPQYSDPPDTIWATYNWWGPGNFYIYVGGNGVIIYEPRLDAPWEGAPAEESAAVRNESWGRIKSQFVQPNH